MRLGIFDSGVGGLTVWQELRTVVPADFIYFGDTAHVPYGDKLPTQLFGYFHSIIDFFQQREVQAIVVACNTMSAVVLPVVKDIIDIQLFSMIDAAVTQGVAVAQSKVGVMATKATASSGSYEQAFQAVRPDLEVVAQSCPKLVPLIEAGLRDGVEVEAAVAEYVTPLVNQGVDTIVLGCTHYPFLLPVIQRYAGPYIRILDPAVQVARDVQEWSKKVGGTMLGQGQTEFWVSGDPQAFQKVAQQFIGLGISHVNRFEMAGETI